MTRDRYKQHVNKGPRFQRLQRTSHLTKEVQKKVRICLAKHISLLENELYIYNLKVGLFITNAHVCPKHGSCLRRTRSTDSTKDDRKTPWSHQHPFKTFEVCIMAIATFPDGERIVSGSVNKTIRIRRLEDGTEMMKWVVEKDIGALFNLPKRGTYDGRL
ncbi:hypothetical protein DFH29DRAFT_911412 [Suillus ampliporus]|nr:hypothetical protein DFH29DRAFT_911412 [Suillus ampliporus]